MADNRILDFQSLLGRTLSGVDEYINDLISDSEGDRDFAIRQLKREHELALGTDNVARAKFLEDVADKLEEKIGTIPYDYQVGVTRTKEDLARTEQITERNTQRALGRLAEDEEVFRREFGRESEEVRGEQQEELLARGILSGTREGAEGLAGKEVGRLETGLTERLGAFERALGRGREDITTESEDILFGARRGAKRDIEDITTQARRLAIGAEDRFGFGTEAEKRRAEAIKKQLERERAKLRGQAPTQVAGTLQALV